MAGSHPCPGHSSLTRQAPPGGQMLGTLAMGGSGRSAFASCSFPRPPFLSHPSGSLLLESLKDHISTTAQDHCKAIYLHVLTTNSTAISF